MNRVTLCAEYCVIIIKLALCAFGGAFGGAGAAAAYAIRNSLRKHEPLPGWPFLVAFTVLGAVCGSTVFVSGLIYNWLPVSVTDMPFESLLSLAILIGLITPAASAGITVFTGSRNTYPRDSESRTFKELVEDEIKHKHGDS